jgi:hypothetical protein
MHCRSSFTSRGALMLASSALMVMLPLSSSRAQGKAVGVIADQPMPDSAQQAAMLAISRRMQSPAAVALTMKQDLGLKPEQVAAIEALVPVEADSMRARMRRVMELVQQNAQKNQGTGQGMGWTDPIDEVVIRAAMCDQSRAQAEMVIGMMRDRHALGALLTVDQQHQFDELQGQIMMRIMQPHK